MKRACERTGAGLIMLSLVILIVVLPGWVGIGQWASTVTIAFLAWCGLVVTGATLFTIGTWKSKEDQCSDRR